MEEKESRVTFMFYADIWKMIKEIPNARDLFFDVMDAAVEYAVSGKDRKFDNDVQRGMFRALKLSISEERRYRAEYQEKYEEIHNRLLGIIDDWDFLEELRKEFPGK